MVVTEIAIVHCAEGNLTDDLSNRLKEAEAIQDEWCSKHLSSPQSKDVGPRTWRFQQVEDPSAVLLAARWDTVAEHYQWIESPENQGIMGGILKHIIQEGDKSLLLLHVEGDVFSSPKDAGYTSLLESSVVSVAPTVVPSDKKVEFQQKFDQVKAIVQKHTKPGLVLGSWAVDGNTEGKEQFLLFGGWPSVERHKELIQTDDFQRWKEVTILAEKLDLKHYRRLT